MEYSYILIESRIILTQEEDYFSRISRNRHQFPHGVDPYKTPGDPESGLLWGINDKPLAPLDSGDNKVQAYNIQNCLTDHPENIIPITRPKDYDPERYELLVRLFEAQPELRGINDYFIFILSWMPVVFPAIMKVSVRVV